MPLQITVGLKGRAGATKLFTADEGAYE